MIRDIGPTESGDVSILDENLAFIRVFRSKDKLE
jgi:hypothetical protein